MSSLVQVTHTNPNMIAKRLDRWNEIFGKNLIIETVEKQLDITYAQMWKMTPERTGYLRSTIKVSKGDEWAQIAVTARYAYYVDQGISPRGSRPKALFWTNSVAGLGVELIIVVRNLFLGNF